MCGFWDVGQGATTRNDRSILRSRNAAMCPKNRAIHLVADSAVGETVNHEEVY